MLKRMGAKSIKVSIPLRDTTKTTKKGTKKSTLPSDEYKDEITPVELQLTGAVKLVISVKRAKEDGLPRLDVREFLTSEKYTGFTKKGINISIEKISPLLDLLSAIETNEKVEKLIAEVKDFSNEPVEKDWEELLKKSVRVISKTIDFSMTRQDLEELAELYQEGKHQEKILAVLEDINYHREYALFKEEDFDSLYEYLDEEWD